MTDFYSINLVSQSSGRQATFHLFLQHSVFSKCCSLLEAAPEHKDKLHIAYD